MSSGIKTTLFIALVLMLGFGIFFLRGALTSVSVPVEFLDARTESAVIAGRIVDLANQSQSVLVAIELADKERRYKDAVALVQEALEKNRLARESAVELALQLERMTQGIPSIAPTKARLLAIDAVNTELTLVSHLITHNDFLFQLLSILEGKFLGEISDTNGKIENLIININLTTQAINTLNDKFANLMNEFDRATR